MIFREPGSVTYHREVEGLERTMQNGLQARSADSVHTWCVGRRLLVLAIFKTI